MSFLVFNITYIPKWYPNGFDFSAIGLGTYAVDVPAVAAIWAIEMALDGGYTAQ